MSHLRKPIVGELQLNTPVHHIIHFNSEFPEGISKDFSGIPLGIFILSAVAAGLSGQSVGRSLLSASGSVALAG